MDFDEYDDVFKIIVVGNSGVGKTHMIHVFAKEKKPGNIMPTIGVDYTSKTMPLPGNRRVKAQIWDTAGQEQYRSITMNQFKKSLGALVVFDITSRNSFASAAEWVQTIRERAEEHVQILLVGNKADLSSQRAVLPEEGEKLSREMGVFYVETTIHEPKSIDSALQKLIEQIDRTKNQTGNTLDQKKGEKLSSVLKEAAGGECKC